MCGYIEAAHLHPSACDQMTGTLLPGPSRVRELGVQLGQRLYQVLLIVTIHGREFELVGGNKEHISLIDIEGPLRRVHKGIVEHDRDPVTIMRPHFVSFHIIRRPLKNQVASPLLGLQLLLVSEVVPRRKREALILETAWELVHIDLGFLLLHPRLDQAHFVACRIPCSSQALSAREDQGAQGQKKLHELKDVNSMKAVFD